MFFGEALTKVCTSLFQEIPSFSYVVTPSKPLKVAFTLGNRGVLRSQEGEGFRKEGGSGEGGKRGPLVQKVLRILSNP